MKETIYMCTRQDYKIMHSNSFFIYFLISLQLFLLFIIFVCWLDAVAEQKPIHWTNFLMTGVFFCYLAAYSFRTWQVNYIRYDSKVIKVSITDRRKRYLLPKFTIFEIELSDITELSLQESEILLPRYLIVQTRTKETLKIDTKMMTRKVFRKIVELCKCKGIKISSAVEAV